MKRSSTPQAMVPPASPPPPLPSKVVMQILRSSNITEHREDINVFLARLNTNLQTGLKPQQISEARSAFGNNVLTPPKEKSALLRFLAELTGLFAILLWVGAILCFVAYALDRITENLYLGIILVAVVLLTGGFSFYQNNKAGNLLRSFASLLPPKVACLRSSHVEEILTSALVPGDVVHVSAGDLVPADCRVMSCSDDFRVDNSAITGESKPQRRTPECREEDPLEAKNLIFSCSKVPEGERGGGPLFLQTSLIITNGRHFWRANILHY